VQTRTSHTDSLFNIFHTVNIKPFVSLFHHIHKGVGVHLCHRLSFLPQPLIWLWCHCVRYLVGRKKFKQLISSLSVEHLSSMTERQTDTGTGRHTHIQPDACAPAHTHIHSHACTHACTRTPVLYLIHISAVGSSDVAWFSLCSSLPIWSCRLFGGILPPVFSFVL